MSGREDSNLRPPEPHSGALAKLRHAPLDEINCRKATRSDQEELSERLRRDSSRSGALLGLFHPRGSMAKRKYCYPWPRPAVTVDTVLFTVTGSLHNLRLRV